MSQMTHGKCFITCSSSFVPSKVLLSRETVLTVGFDPVKSKETTTHVG